MADGAASAVASTGVVVNGFPSDPTIFTVASLPQPSPSDHDDSITLKNVLAYLRKRNFKMTESLLVKEAGVLNEGSVEVSESAELPESSTPFDYDEMFKQVTSLIALLDSLFESIRAELSTIFFPVLLHLYVKIIKAGHITVAQDLLQRYAKNIPSYHSIHFNHLRSLIQPGQILNSIIQPYLNNLYAVRFCKAVNKQFDQFLVKNSIIQSIVREHIRIDVSEVSPDSKEYEFYTGSVVGQPPPHKREKIFFGVNRDDIVIVGDKKKKKDAKDLKKKDVQAPPADRIPFPNLPEAVLEDRRTAYRDCTKKGRICQDTPPSVCLVSVCNTNCKMASAAFAEYSPIYCLGMSDGSVEVRTLDNKKFRTLKPMEEWRDHMDDDFEDFECNPYDDESKGREFIAFNLHTSAVTTTAFSADRRSLFTGSLDRTVRLFNLDLHSEMAMFHHHSALLRVTPNYRGLYFGTSSADGVINYYSTERPYPLRTFVDSYASNHALDFHPNGNYLLGGCEDRLVRMWDVAVPHCVRTFTGHHGGVRGMKVSPDGRHCVTVATDGGIIVWDIGSQKSAAVVYSEPAFSKVPIQFTPDSSVFAISSPHCGVSFYTIDSLISGDISDNSRDFSFQQFRTKRTPIFDIQFNRRSTVLTIGGYCQ